MVGSLHNIGRDTGRHRVTAQRAGTPLNNNKHSKDSWKREGGA